LHALRRGVESIAPAERASGVSRTAMTERGKPAKTGNTQTIRELREFVAALDRRVPHVERVGEAKIARDAAALRTRAMRRIEELVKEDESS
jgi:hypothetical protein